MENLLRKSEFYIYRVGKFSRTPKKERTRLIELTFTGRGDPRRFN